MLLYLAEFDPLDPDLEHLEKNASPQSQIKTTKSATNSTQKKISNIKPVTKPKPNQPISKTPTPQ